MSVTDKMRNNKLEYFLMKNLHPSVYNNIRLYEAVIVRIGNSLSYRQAVLTGEDLYLTETPPRTLTHLLTAANITDVQLIHDLPEFLRGGVRDKTTHIMVRYRPATHYFGKLKTPRQGHPATYSEPSTTSIDEEDEHESGPGTHAAHALALAAHDTASICSDPVVSPRLSLDSMPTRNADILPINSSKIKRWEGNLATHHSLANGTLGSNSRSSHLTLTAHNTLSSVNGAKLPVRPQSPNLDNTLDDRSHTPMIADLLSRVSGRQVTRSTTPDALPHTKIHRSLSALENYHRSSPLGLDIPTRSKSVLDKPSTGHAPQQSHSLNFTDVTDSKEDEKEVHLYTLSTSTLLFHLLHSLWVSSSLIKTQKLEKIRPAFQEVCHEHTLDHAFGQLQAELLAASTLEDQFSILQELQQGIRKYSTIRRLVWRDSDVISKMRSFIKQYMKHSSSPRRGEDTEEELQVRQDELEMLTLTLETLTMCLRGTQWCPFKMKMLKHNKYECLRNLIMETVKTPEVPASFKLTCRHWLTDFRELSSHAWENLPESELLKLVQEVTHTSTSALYELLGSVNELSWVYDVQPDAQDITPNLNALLQHVPVEGWLSYSVPQLLVLLQPERVGKDTESNPALIHQYCSVLAVLLHHSPRALQYCTTHYAEELRYYVHESLISCRLSESCPIRPHTLKIVQMIAQLIRSKSSLRAR
ncbi:uncharacterized protein C12orf56-like [Panulirus ornatus]|uniref:uncharacterized protein C12orf56-like n=1 Tax=Panulirus ornatus TaxID=150431 RepID=UPI003A8A1B0C